MLLLLLLLLICDCGSVTTCCCYSRWQVLICNSSCCCLLRWHPALRPALLLAGKWPAVTFLQSFTIYWLAALCSWRTTSFRAGWYACLISLLLLLLLLQA
jgi:hypothetical protein